MPDRLIRVLFVCLGNICRSPLAEGVFRTRVEDAGLIDHFLIDSAGTGSWHVGQRADARMRATAKKRGVDLGAIRGRQLAVGDLQKFDHIFAMDRYNLHDILCLDLDGDHGTRVRLFREFDPEPGDHQVPDPYYGGPDGFDEVFAIVDRTCEAILARFRESYRL